MKRSIASFIGFTVFASGCNFDMFTHDTSVPASHSTASGSVSSIVSKDAASAISRNSGAATQIRLTKLFPSASQTGAFNPDNFSFLNASGIFSTLGADTKPTTALAQIALRQQATNLCNSQVGGSSDTSAIFSTTDILLSGESLPTDPVQKLAFAAARNIWLDAYTVDMPEVQQLITLYKSVVNSTTGATGDLGARRAICEAAILAPQFWMGGGLATDVIRKVALEIGRRRPTFSEISQYKAGTLTLTTYVEKIQKEAGYLEAVNDWHQSWLGLRNFFPNGDPRGDSATPNGSVVNGASYLSGYNFIMNAAPAGAGFVERVYSPNHQGDMSPETCSPVAQNFDPRTIQMVWEQRDTNPAPPAALTDEGWNVLGGSIHVDGVAAFKARLRALYFTRTGETDAYSADRNASRSLIAQTYTDENGLFTSLCAIPTGTTSWYQCNGVVLLPSSLRTQLETEYATLVSHTSATWADGKDVNHSFYVEKSQLDNILVWNTAHSHIVHMRTPINGIVNTNRGTLSVTIPAGFNGNTSVAFYGNNDGAFTPLSSVMNWPAATGTKIRSPIAFFQPGWRKLRRYSPSGEQNGYSLVNTWYRNTPVRVCNSLDRFTAACFYRPVSGNVTYSTAATWNASQGNLTYVNGANVSAYFPSFANYLNIGNFKCGTPSVSNIVADTATAYPQGYDYTLGTDGAYHYGALQSLNTLASAAGVADSTQTSDDQTAMTNIKNDIENEPYHLIDYLVSNNLDYRQLLTANYTCGSKDFARHYQTQGYFLPVSPEQIDSNIGKVGASCSVPNGDANLYRVEHQGIQLSMNLIRNTTNAHFAAPSGCQYLKLNSASKDEPAAYQTCVNNLPSINGSGTNLTDINPKITTIPERVMSGILTMPAFVAPVMPSPRTFSSRFFTRLLCGDPAMFKPTAAQTTMQSAYVSGRSHLQSQCISCHINLDPLASAFSSSFKYYEGTSQFLYPMMGEFAPAGMGAFYNIVGIRAGGGNKGVGAFFGNKVTGVEELGQAVANSSQFASCVVQKTFQNVMGRPPGVTDVTFITTETTRFQNTINYNYNKLVEDIITSSAFTEKQ